MLVRDRLHVCAVVPVLLGTLTFISVSVSLQALAQRSTGARIEWIDAHVPPIGGRGRFTDYPSPTPATQHSSVMIFGVHLIASR